MLLDSPEEYGGLGIDDFRFNQVIAEEGQYAGATGSMLGITLHNDVCFPYFMEYCTDEQKERWIPGIVDGSLITAVAMTEPGIGSDLASMSTKAIRDGDHYVVDGSKTFITNGINADLIITAVKTDPSSVREEVEHRAPRRPRHHPPATRAQIEEEPRVLPRVTRLDAVANAHLPRHPGSHRRRERLALQGVAHA